MGTIRGKVKRLVEDRGDEKASTSSYIVVK